jgi:hypothetical protein
MIVEELVTGHGNHCRRVYGEQALPIIEIIPPVDGEFDFANKYNGTTQELCPPEHVSSELQKTSAGTNAARARGRRLPRPVSYRLHYHSRRRVLLARNQHNPRHDRGEPIPQNGQNRRHRLPRAHVWTRPNGPRALTPTLTCAIILKRTKHRITQDYFLVSSFLGLIGNPV